MNLYPLKLEIIVHFLIALKYVSSMYTEKRSRKIFIAFVRNNRHHHEQNQGNV